MAEQAMTAVPKDHPLSIEWEKYRTSTEYANTRKWAMQDAHVDGSLWAAFMAGFIAANPNGYATGGVVQPAPQRLVGE